MLGQQIKACIQERADGGPDGVGSFVELGEISGRYMNMGRFMIRWLVDGG